MKEKYGWSEEKMLCLIQEFKQHKLLWHPAHFKTTDKSTKNEAWKKISETVDESVETCQKKMNSLMASQRRENLKTIRGWENKFGNLFEIKTLYFHIEYCSDTFCINSVEKAKNKPYKSKWFAFNELSFLNNRCPLRVDLSTESETLVLIFSLTLILFRHFPFVHEIIGYFFSVLNKIFF